MWILLRLAFAAAGFWARLDRLRRGRSFDELAHGSIAEWVDQDKDKAKVRGFRMEVSLPTPAYCRFERERWYDRKLKRLGFASELQTGDRAFDRKLYVISDHEGVALILKANAAAREFVLQAFAAGATHVTLDGRRLVVRNAAGRAPAREDRQLIRDLGRAFAPLARELGTRYRDPFARRKALVEAVVWALACYAIATGLDYVFSSSAVHVDGWDLYAPGLAVGAAMFVALLMLIVRLLRGSSGGHRIVTESFILLALGLPLLGIQVVADLNVALDRSDPVEVTRVVDGFEHDRWFTSKRGRNRWYTLHYYWLVLRAADRPDEWSDRIGTYVQVPRATANMAAIPGRTAYFRIRRGGLGIPWYEDIRVSAYAPEQRLEPKQR